MDIFRQRRIQQLRTMFARALKFSDIGSNQYYRAYKIVAPIIQIATLLGVYGIFLNKTIIIFFSVVLFIGSILVGIFWFRTGILREELRIDATANPLLVEINERLKRLEKDEKL